MQTKDWCNEKCESPHHNRRVRKKKTCDTPWIVMPQNPFQLTPSASQKAALFSFYISYYYLKDVTNKDRFIQEQTR